MPFFRFGGYRGTPYRLFVSLYIKGGHGKILCLNVQYKKLTPIESSKFSALRGEQGEARPHSVPGKAENPRRRGDHCAKYLFHAVSSCTYHCTPGLPGCKPFSVDTIRGAVVICTNVLQLCSFPCNSILHKYNH